VKVFSHTRTTAFFVLAALALLAFVAPSAMADNCNAPPGTSGIDQYCESIPSPGGAGGGGKHSGSGSDTHKLSPSTTRKLQQTDAGQTVLALTNSTAGAPASSDTSTPAKKQLAKHHRTKKHQSSTQSTTNSSPTPAAPRDTTPAAKTSFGVGDSLSGSLGAGFLVLLIVIAGLFGFLAWLSHRDRREPRPY
jgi:hypothetical protein